MKRKLLLIVIAAVTAFVCAFGFIACTDDEDAPDLSSVNGTYELFLAEIEEDGSVSGAEIVGQKDDLFMRTIVLKDGKVTTAGQSDNYTLRGDDIIVIGIDTNDPDSGKTVEWVFEKVADGVYVEKVYSWNCWVKDGATAPFPLNRHENQH